MLRYFFSMFIAPFLSKDPSPAGETKRVGFPIFLYIRRPVGAESLRRTLSSPENLLILKILIQIGSFSFKKLWTLSGSGAVRKPHLPGWGVQNLRKNGKLNSPVIQTTTLENLPKADYNRRKLVLKRISRSGNGDQRKRETQPS